MLKHNGDNAPKTETDFGKDPFCLPCPKITNDYVVGKTIRFETNYNNVLHEMRAVSCDLISWRYFVEAIIIYSNIFRQ